MAVRAKKVGLTAAFFGSIEAATGAIFGNLKKQKQKVVSAYTL